MKDHAPSRTQILCWPTASALALCVGLALGCTAQAPLEPKTEDWIGFGDLDWQGVVLQGALCETGQAAVQFSQPHALAAWHFDAPEGAQASFSVEGPPGIDTVIALYGPQLANAESFAGPPLVTDDDGGPGRLSALTAISIPKSGTYALLLGTYLGNSRGEVVVKMQLSAPCGLPAPCDDGDPCTLNVVKPAGCNFEPINCNDNDPCTIDACSKGECTHTPLPSCNVECTSSLSCDDGDLCTVDRCEDGLCVHSPKDCSTGDLCVVGTCQFGLCAFSQVICDDGDPCTIDTCVAGLCAHTPMICANPDDCATAACADGNCVITPKDCGDGDDCTHDSCAAGECFHTQIECDDGVACTVDVCASPGGFCVHTPSDGLCGDAGPGATCNPIAPAADADGCTKEVVPPCDVPDGFEVCQFSDVEIWRGPMPEAGEWLICRLSLAAISPSCAATSCRATAASFFFGYDNEALELHNFYDVICFAGDQCFMLPVALLTIGSIPSPSTPFVLHPSGHNIAVYPESAKAWNQQGWGTVSAINVASPLMVLSEASLDGNLGGNLTGEPEFLYVFFKPSPKFQPGTPTSVCLGSTTLFNGLNFVLPFEWDPTHRMMVTY